MKQSAGLLLYRHGEHGLEFFLTHPGGPFFARRNEGVWSIPKGELDEGEDPLHAAIREFEEETGLAVQGDFIPLDPIMQKGGKKVFCWAVAGDFDPALLKSNTFDLEWPPKSGKNQSFPEIDRGGWFTFEEAGKLMRDRQIPLLEQLIAKLA